MAALMLIKRACAAVNLACGLLPSDKARAIKAAADEVLAGQHAGEFPLSVWQTGSGTSQKARLAHSFMWDTCMRR